MPVLFDWVDVPPGQVTLITEKDWRENYIPEGEAQTFDVPAFAITKYPVTNAQYARFLKAGGYQERLWWTERGWQAIQSSR
jgi:formylglycine-generating enzyme required for sulfatase activity